MRGQSAGGDGGLQLSRGFSHHFYRESGARVERWTNPDNPRCAVFNCYNSIWSQWHRLNVAHEVIEAMPPKRRTLFRGTWELGGNTEYSLENRAL